MRVETDWDLVHRYVTAQDDRAFTTLVARHRTAVREAVTRTLTRGHAEALADLVDDVEQQVWCRLWEWAHRLTPSDRVLAGWLCVVAANLARNALRNHRRDRRVITRDVTWDGAPLPSVLHAPARDETARYPEHREALEAVAHALNRVSPAFRTVVLLRAEGLAYPVIARLLGIREGTVKSRLARARVAVGVELEDAA